jgi:hypothetical protein
VPLHAQRRDNRRIQRGVAFGLDKSQLIEHRVSVPRAIKQQLRSGIKGNQKIFVAVMAGLNKVRQGIAGALNFVSAH